MPTTLGQAACCLVVAEGPNPKNGAPVQASVPFFARADGNIGGAVVAVSCSGTVLPFDAAATTPTTTLLVAAPLSLLSPFSSSVSSPAGSASLPPGVRLRVLLPPTHEEDEQNNTAWRPAELAAVARVPAAAATLRAALARLRSADGAGRWRLGWALAPWSKVDDVAAAADEAASFLVLRVVVVAGSLWRPPPPPPPPCPACCGDGQSPPRLPPIAEPVVAWGAPFGALAPWHFAGSAVRGVVSGALGGLSSPSSSSVARLDVAALPGMEGGPVCCGSCGRVAGVLSCPLVRRAKSAGGSTGEQAEAAEVPLALALGPLLEACERALLAEGSIAPRATSVPSTPQRSSLSNALARGVVMVRRGGAWATGVVMPRGRREAAAGAATTTSATTTLVLTIAHLFDDSAQQGGGRASPLHVRLPPADDGQEEVWAPATLLHRFEAPHLDLAVLLVAAGVVPDGRLLPLELAPPSPAAAARPVVVAGHGLFGPRLGWPAAATAGTLARCVASSSADAAPATTMALTTASVRAGASGGAVLDPHTAQLLAVVTSNSRHTPPQAGAPAKTLPRWNYAAPAEVLRALWRWAEEEEEEGGGVGGSGGPGGLEAARAALRAMDRRAAKEGGEAAARVWALLPPSAAGGGQEDKVARARL
jgi:hypothetical protein